MKSKKLLKLLFQKVFDDNIIEIIASHYGKKWCEEFKSFKKIKIRHRQKGKKKHSFSYHYYYH